MDMRCECIQCCDGEHAGFCKECAGWGSNDEEIQCSRCEGTGTCPICDGDELPSAIALSSSSTANAKDER